MTEETLHHEAVPIPGDQVGYLIATAARAPSVHNTQPWRFAVTPTGLDLYADRSRQLTVLDPTGRQLMVSCGAALGLATLATRTLGHSCTVELLPDDDIDHRVGTVV